jgi:hypothetical protein
MLNRGSIDRQELDSRLNLARQQREDAFSMKEFSHKVINEKLEVAVSELFEITKF